MGYLMGYLSNNNIKIFSEITFPMKLLVVMIEAVRNKNAQIFEKMKYLQNQLNLLTESNKAIYYLLVTRKLTDAMTKSLIRINS